MLCQNKALQSICIIAVAAVLFRCDMLVLLLPTTLLMLVTKEVAIWHLFHQLIWIIHWVDKLLEIIFHWYCRDTSRSWIDSVGRFLLLETVFFSCIPIIIYVNFIILRWLWPEGVVLFFNTVENRSSEWGVMAWHWYFTNALPKVLLKSLKSLSYFMFLSCSYY